MREWSPDDAAAADSAASPPAAGGNGSSSLPFDPQRFIGAVRRHRHWLWRGAAVGLVLALGVGLLKAKTRYEVSLELIKRYTQPTFQFGINGEPYKPRVFTAATLASAARSPNVLERVARRFGHGISADLLKTSILVKEDKITDFVTLTLSGYQSAEATVALAKVWTDEVVSFTGEMQSQDSRSIRLVLQTQLENNQRELEQLDKATMKLTGSERLMVADAQVDGYLHSQAEAETKFDAARTELQSVTSKIEGVKAELQQLTPLTEELRTARAELDQFRTRYTDTNPLVIDRQEKVAALEARLKAPEKPVGGTDVNSLSGTFVSNALYLRMVELENQRDAVERQIQELEKKRDQYHDTPVDTSQIMEMLQKKQTLRTAQSLLLSRLQEVRLFEENPPAFYGVFAPADIENIVTKRKPLKVAVYGIGGLIGGAMCGLGAVLLVGFRDPKLRTRGEAAKTLGVPLLGALAAGGGGDDAAELGGKVWARWIGCAPGGRKARAVWSPALDESENDFWRMMLGEARKLLPGLLVVDCGASPLPALAELPRITDDAGDFAMIHRPIENCSLHEARQFAEWIEVRLARGSDVWVRFAGPVQEPATTLARCLHAPLVLVPLHRTEVGFWKEQAALFRHSALSPCGALVLNETPCGQSDVHAK